jgi:predicted DNA-binding transcriptional regulator YafY
MFARRERRGTDRIYAAEIVPAKRVCETGDERRVRLPRVEITEQERERLLALVEEARRDDAADTVLASLAAKLKAGGGPAFARYSELLESGGEPDPQVAARVRDAVETSSPIRIRYTSRSSGETTERVVRPFNVHFYDGREYLEAFCELRDADRLFAIAGIEAILTEPSGDREADDSADR